MKIVFLTDKCPIAAVVLRQIKNCGIPLHTIFIENTKPLKKLERSINRCGLIGTSKAILEKTMRMLRLKMFEDWLKNDFYYAYSNKVCFVDDINGKQCEQLLREIIPDIIVLGCTRIVRGNILNIPRLGTLNAHPGLLPKYRGLDTVLWAIYNRDFIGATIHFVDEGVDTGAIVMQKIVDIEENDTIDSLRNKVRVVAGKLMAETIKKLIQGEHISVSLQSVEDGQQYREMPKNLLSETLRRLDKIKRMAGR
jgi:methionyl-tRNA formyltransferase